MDSRPPSYRSATSMSPSTTTLSSAPSRADAMLEASLSGSISVASPGSVAFSSNPSGLSSRQHSRSSKIKTSSKTSGSATLSYRPKTHENVPPGGTPRRQESRGTAPVRLFEKGALANPLDSKISSRANTLTSITAAESKQRLRQMQLAMQQANAQKPLRDTAGLFKKSCSTDLLFLIDTTSSMGPYIGAARNQVKNIVRDIKATFLDETEVRIAVVGYKDHSDGAKSIQFLDFVTSSDDVSSFLDSLTAKGGADAPEDVLGGIRQATNASWKLQTRCLIHITDAPPHGGILHDLGKKRDNYYEHGSEPHGLTYTPLLNRLVHLKINYALLRINPTTDRTVLRFSEMYAAAGADVRPLKSNKYCGQINDLRGNPGSDLQNASGNKRGAELQFEELELGTSFSMLQHLVVRTVTRSVSLAATRVMTSLDTDATTLSGGDTSKGSVNHLLSISEYGEGYSGPKPVTLEKISPQWDKTDWFNETLVLEGFCPDMGVHSASTLNEMMDSDASIKLSVTQLTVHKRHMPFAEGAIRLASYARTAASTDRFVVKSFKADNTGMEQMIEDMRAQALCKAFALEFNSLLKEENNINIDFIVTTCLQNKSETASKNTYISLEPFIEGVYVKYNSNGGFVRQRDSADPFNDAAQAFSHFTYERSWGSFLVSDLQGVGHVLTDPAIQTKDPERFKLGSTNGGIAGFKFFFATHTCNSICQKLQLKSNKTMFKTNHWEFREEWPTMDDTVCCSNKLCRKIILLADAQKSDKFPGCHWCSVCWPQLQSTTVQRNCDVLEGGHTFDVSVFFYESQGRSAPRKCPEHTERDTTAFSAAAMSGNLWERMRNAGSKTSVNAGRAW